MAQLSPEQLIEEAEGGTLRPVYVVSGEERFYVRRVISALRRAVVGASADESAPSLNEDQFHAGEVDVSAVLSAARTLPMFGPRRLVLLWGTDRWEGKDDATRGRKKGIVLKPLDQLADYAAKPSESTTLVIVGEKLDQRRRLMSAARKSGFLVVCASPSRAAVPGWIRQRVGEHGHSISARAADLMAELVGTDLSSLCDAIERVELYVGPGQALTEEAVGECVANVQVASVWDLVDAVGRRDAAAALASLDRVFEPGGGPRLVGLLSWSARQLIRFASARRAGLSESEAARKAGVPPFKVSEVSRQTRQLTLQRAELWLEALADVDENLKGGSRLPQKAVLETALLSFCR